MAAGLSENKRVYGARVAGTPQFYPGFTKQDGTTVSERCVVPVLVNIPGRKDPNTGIRADGIVERYYITAWGNAAHDFAKNCAMGKELSYIELRQSQYRGSIYVDGQPIVDKQGQPVTQTKTSNSVVNYRWGDDSEKTINREMEQGIRPYAWDGKLPIRMLLAVLSQGGPNGLVSFLQQAQHGEEQWKRMLEQRRSATFQPGMKTYGFAEVNESGQTNTGGAPAAPNYNTNQGNVAQATAGQAPAQNAYQAPPSPQGNINPFGNAPQSTPVPGHTGVPGGNSAEANNAPAAQANVDPFGRSAPAQAPQGGQDQYQYNAGTAI